MKTRFFILSFILLFTFSCQQEKPSTNTSLSDSVDVYAKRRFYNPDGTRTYGDYEPYQTMIVENLSGFEPTGSEFTKYGGWAALKLDSTGFFHVTKKDGRWWAVDPTGHAFIHMAINSLNMGKSLRNKEALKEKFGDEKGWITETARMIQNYGFNGAGSWSDTEAVRYANTVLDQPLAYTINLNFMSSYADERGGTWQVPGHKAYPNDAIFVFDPEFETFCDKHAQQVLENKDDPNLFGYFSDNEMPFKQSAILDYLGLKEDDPGHEAARQWMLERGITEDQINDEIKDAFRAHVADTYLGIVSAALKKHDPNHMYLGARFYSGEKHNQAFMEAAGRHMDIVSNNYYNRWTPDSKEMDEWARWTGRPFIITEYYTKGEDSGMPNQSGAGWIVKTQKDRGMFYVNFGLGLLSSQNCVGWHYFKYQDNDPTLEGAEPSNVDSNKGIVNNYYEPWKPMLDEMKKLNENVYELTRFIDEELPN